MTKNILLIGQNFSGKTDFFKNIVGGRTRQYYYPQTKIPISAGHAVIGGVKYRIIDAPGIYTLIPTSEHEMVTLNLILNLQPEKIIFVTQEDTLETSLLIMIQLAELGIPFVVGYQVENSAQQEYLFDQDKLAHVFNTQVVISSPVVQPNTKKLKKALERCRRPRWVGNYSRVIEKNLREFEQRFKSLLPPQQKIAPRFLCLMLLLGNKNIYAWIRRSYPLEIAAPLLKFADAKYEIAHSFTIANRWESLTGSLFQEVWQKKQSLSWQRSYFFEKYSLRFFWDICIAALALTGIFGFVYLVGNKLLINIFYNELLGKYVLPFIAYILDSLFGKSLLTNFFIGPYGLVSTGLVYVLGILLPLLASFFFIYALLENTGYINRLCLTLHRFLRLFRLNGYAAPALLFSCCKITALNKSKTLYSRKERVIVLLLLLFGLPCFSQLIVTLNLLSIIPLNYTLIFGGVLLAQLFIILNLQRLLPGQQTGSNYLTKVTPLHLPEPGKVLATAWMYTRWYLHEILPLIISVSLLLFVLDAFGALSLLKTWLAPLTRTFLDMPDAFTDSIILGFFRKDLGAMAIYDLANNGMLNSIQVLVSCLFLSLSAPCLGFVSELSRQKGWRTALLVFVFSVVYAFTIAALVNKILRV